MRDEEPVQEFIYRNAQFLKGGCALEYEHRPIQIAFFGNVEQIHKT